MKFESGDLVRLDRTSPPFAKNAKSGGHPVRFRWNEQPERKTTSLPAIGRHPGWEENALEFAQGYGYGTCGCADGWEETAQDAHDQGEEDSEEQEIQGDFEGEGDVGKGLKIHGVGGPTV